ncbi:DNA polymerase III subunit delta [Actinomycetospora straminea]|uniref:DNA-directed DNA polymerase n=1 Tax=Actinomycetospora straminea TaxID=663607 RepID=A0ABP9ENI6_9PSEU|nr:DNA polymerase III subunit delta [Actinomycetospora straminea]MDD7933500.1 DNA polymerase III subunit delta [Actinomycetospora straminea]
MSPSSTSDAPGPLHLVVGDEGLLVERAVARAIAAARDADPAVEVTRLPAGELTAGGLSELVSPSLFAESRVVVVENGHDAGAEVTTLLLDYAKAPSDGVTLVVVHRGPPKSAGRRPARGAAKGGKGGGKGDALLEGLRGAGATEASAASLSDDQRADFVRTEVRQAGGKITGEALGLLMDAVGSDLRELAAAASQLASDSGGHVDADAVRAFHRGRAEVTGFAVADRAMTGDRTGALEALRWALDTGVPHVVVADALADGVRTAARVGAVGRGDPYSLASSLKMPPWKVRRGQQNGRGWSAEGLAQAMGVVADLNADVKGAAADPSYALEHAVELVVAAQGSARGPARR